jgi:hypothetical protein
MIRRCRLFCVLLSFSILSGLLAALAALAAQSDDLQTQIWQGGGTAFMKGREWRAAWCRPDGQVGHGKATR